MANPRKFSEKIALQKQKQAEGTAEFEKIMKEVHATKMDETQPNQKIFECCFGVTDDNANNSTKVGGGGGSGAGSGASGGGASPEATVGSSGGGGGGGGGSPTAYRESRGRSVGLGPMRRPSERKQDRSPYGSSTNTNAIGISGNGGPVGPGLTNNVQNIAYLSPPMDSSWRRSNSDSALHQSLNMAIAGESGFGGVGVAGVGGMPPGLGALHANYQHHHHHGQRSQSPNIGRSFSPQAQRRKGNLIQQQQQQQQQFLQHHLQLQQHQQQQQQQQQQQIQHSQQTQQQQMQQHLQMQHQQQQQSQQAQQHNVPPQPLNYNAKFPNCNNIPATNSLFKSLQDQAMTFANTGSLPDLTSVHYAQQQPTQHHQQQQQQQQQQHHHQQQQQQHQHTLSPTLSPHNNGRDRDQSPSPFSPAGGGGGGGGPPSPYQQQHHSPTSAANTPTAAQTSSPHLSFTNLSVQSPTPVAQTGSFGNLTTLGAASSAGNLTDYRQPLNPPSPGSSPGLLTSASGNELHTSAPASPTRHPQTSLQHSLQGYNDKNIQNFDRYSPTIGGSSGGGGSNSNSTGNNATNASGNGGSSNIDSTYNSLNPSFHNHFEQFSLGDSNSSPDQTHYQSNTFGALEFEDFVSGGSGGQHVYSQTLGHSKILDFNDLTAPTSDSSATHQHNTTTSCNTTSLQQQPQQQQSGRNIDQQQQQRLLTNNGVVSNGPCRPNSSNVSSNTGPNPTTDATNGSSPLPSPLGSCLPSPSSPLPIPMSTQQAPHHHHQQQHQHAQNHNHQLSLSLHSQHSPHHSPLHSPHHPSASPLSASSPSGITAMTCGSGIAQTVTASVMHPSNQAGATQHQQQHQQQQQQQQQQNHSANTPTTNIPSIIFSDYSSNSDFSREIFDSLDLDLEQIDVAGLQMLSDQNTVMIADSTIEDSFRRDLN